MPETVLLNRYRLDAELGRGGMGVVYRAHDLRLDRAVAVKVVNDAGLGSAGRARLLFEAQAAARLNHPNIVAIYDVDEADGAPFVVMELVSGPPLHEFHAPDLPAKVALARQICAALEHAHTHGIIHRDLKPDNVVIDLSGAPAGLVKLLDFGLARTADARRLTEEGVIVGTIAYLAPEILQGQPASPSSDLYALGVMLYELAAGRPPFAGDNLLAVASQHLNAPVVPPSNHAPDLPQALDRLIVALLAKNPESRPASAAAVGLELEQMLAGPERAAAEALPAAEAWSLLDRIARGQLVAREPELAEALRLWKQAAHGAGQALLISGDPGVGKTRLARELFAKAQISGAAALTGECAAEGGAPYAPIAQMLLAAFTAVLPALPALPAPVLADLLVLAPALRALYPDVPPNLPLEPLAERQRIFDSAVQCLTALSARAPVLLFLDDAHWADSGTLLLLRHLARRLRELRVLLVLTYRDVELGEARPFHEFVQELNRERLVTRLPLRPFDRAQTEAQLSALFQEEITPELLDGIYRQTDGNPFFIEEVCRALIDAGQLRREGGRWRRNAMAEIEVPHSVRVTIELRVAKLPEAAQEALRAAAVLGREFEFDVLRELLGSSLDEDALIDAMEAAERAQLISAVKKPGAPVFAFAHALTPQALREGLSTLRCQRLHRRAAQAIERVHAGQLASGDYAAVLAGHAAEAGDQGRAADLYLQAADRARGSFAYPEAIQYLRQALAIFQAQSAAGLTRAARTAMTLAQLYHTVFDFERAQQMYAEAFALWERIEDAQRRAAPAAGAQTLRLIVVKDLSLDLTATGWEPHLAVIRQLFTGLLESTFDLDLTPALARAWEITDGGRRYVFHLQPDVRWSDGQRVTAHDFEFTWKRQLAPNAPTRLGDMLFNLRNARAYFEGRAPADQVGVRAADDLTLMVDLEEPAGHFLHLLASTPTFAIPRHAVAAHGAQWATPEHIVTYGPFHVAAWQPGQSLHLARNPDYRGVRTGNVERVELALRNVPFEESLRAYAENACDMLGVGGRQVTLARQQFAAELTEAARAMTAFVYFYEQCPPFNDRRVRQALVQAVDRPAMTRALYERGVVPALGGFVPPGLPGHSPGLGLPFAPARARQLLAEAGYPGGQGFPVIQAYCSTKGFLDWLNYLQQQWREVLGIDLRANLVAHEDWEKQKAWPEAHLVAISWQADYPDPHNFIADAAALRYTTGWRNADFEALLAAANRLTDPAERTRLYQAADRLLVQEAALLPLFYLPHIRLLKPWVRRFPVSPLGWPHWQDVVIEPH